MDFSTGATAKAGRCGKTAVGDNHDQPFEQPAASLLNHLISPLSQLLVFSDLAFCEVQFGIASLTRKKITSDRLLAFRQANFQNAAQARRWFAAHLSDAFGLLTTLFP